MGDVEFEDGVVIERDDEFAFFNPSVIEMFFSFSLCSFFLFDFFSLDDFLSFVLLLVSVVVVVVVIIGDSLGDVC